MDEIVEFTRTYTSNQRPRIEFAWNGKHAADLCDANRDFRSSVDSFICEDPGQAQIELIRDLFIEESKWSIEAWCAPFTFPRLGELLLTRGGADYLTDFLQGCFASFDTLGACHQMKIDPVVIAPLIRELEQRINGAPDEGQKNSFDSGRALLEKLQTGTASKGWATVQPGTPVENVRVVGPGELAFRRFKNRVLKGLRLR